MREPADARRRSSRTRGDLTSCRRMEKEARASRNPEPRCPFASADAQQAGGRRLARARAPHVPLAGRRGPQASSLPRALSGPTQRWAAPRASLLPLGPPKRLGKLPRLLLGHGSRAPAATLREAAPRVGAGWAWVSLPPGTAARALPAATHCAPRAVAIFSWALRPPTCKSSPRSQTRFAGFVPQVANLTHTE